MVKTRQIVLAGAIAACFAGSAFAADQKIILASLDDVTGKVLVNQGKGFVSAKPGMEVRTGDRVIALDKASAKVVYSDGCVTDLKENSLFAMDNKGCENKPVNSRSNDIILAQAIGGPVVRAGGPAAGGVSLGSLLPFAGFAGGFGLAFHVDSKNDNTPVSGQ